VLNNVTAAFDQTAKGVGIPTVITTNSVKYLAVGTSFGNVVLFKVGDKGKNVLGNADNRKYGAITSIAISREGRYLVSGQENGLITIWDLGTMSELKK
jgi:WD40 repeat protein